MRTLIEELEAEFESVETRLRSILAVTPENSLFARPFPDDRTMIELSVGGCIIRAAAMIEQAFLGITRRLWDDPFEWTLPEELSTCETILRYIDEVSEARAKGIAFLASDADLAKQLPAPEKLRSIFAVLIEALLRAEYFRGKADALVRAAKRSQD
ncbi:MAG TPA: hypothetical protein VGJ02_01220 [Pyrinomonadaceae bacterium]